MTLELGPQERAYDSWGSLDVIVHSFCILCHFRAVGREQAVWLLWWTNLTTPSPSPSSQGEKGRYCPGSRLLRSAKRPPLCCPSAPGLATWFQE